MSMEMNDVDVTCRKVPLWYNNLLLWEGSMQLGREGGREGFKTF